MKLEEYEAKPYYLINSVLLDSQVPIHDLFNVKTLGGWYKNVSMHEAYI
jgi:hypothetical protein